MKGSAYQQIGLREIIIHGAWKTYQADSRQILPLRLGYCVHVIVEFVWSTALNTVRNGRSTTGTLCCARK